MACWPKDARQRVGLHASPLLIPAGRGAVPAASSKNISINGSIATLARRKNLRQQNISISFANIFNT
jgi:hypothetical protein